MTATADRGVPENQDRPASGPAAAEAPTRPVPALSFFFPAHNEVDHVEALVAEALETLPRFAERFEIICVNDGSRDGTAEIADRLAAEHPDLVRAVHNSGNQGYGAALRSGIGAARHPLVAFTDGDRQFRIADLGRLLARLEGSDAPDGVLGYRLRRADPFVRRTYARIYRLCLRIFFGLPFRDPDCAFKLFRREALASVRLESGGAFLSAELLIKLRARGRRLVEVGVPHYPRTAGQQSGANPKVILRAIRDFWRLRLGLWFNREGTLRRGVPLRAE